MQFLATIVQGPHHSIFGAYTIPPFRFQPRNGSVDWRRMSVLDVDRVIRELDVATLQENLTDITFCTLDGEECSHCLQPLDQGLLNVLRLAQLSIEYLMHCQDFLMTRVTLLELHLQASLRQQSQSQQQLDSQAEELMGLREETHQQRQMIKDLQQLLQWSGGQSYYMVRNINRARRAVGLGAQTLGHLGNTIPLGCEAAMGHSPWLGADL
ncbi:hypothetical protein HJG60_011541 [Phyllostomus discolor]|uniref:Cilium assembly protein DZIP1 N-terminal domain-containing protein n=1 Tax=Phyllostomus discolor TaxID=89673 RepID=A0A833ZTU3_9CHIR|nr:hypothetical protein HJG60_011541 [Phyllostomus discolor]